MENKHEIRKLIGDKPDPIIFEIGSADGKDTEQFLYAFNDLDFKMYCFEPDKRNLKVFKKTIKDNRIKLFEGVIGDKTGEVAFYTSTKSRDKKVNLIYSSSLRRPAKALFEVPKWEEYFQSEKDNFKPTVVESVTLDDFVLKNNIPYISYVFADVQGCEDLMIIGGKNTFDTKVRYLYTEYSNKEYYMGEPNLAQILSLLPNYELLIDFGTDVLLKNRRL